MYSFERYLQFFSLKFAFTMSAAFNESIQLSNFFADWNGFSKHHWSVLFSLYNGISINSDLFWIATVATSTEWHNNVIHIE